MDFFLQEWREIDKKLTESINEARDHYKFLMIVAKHVGPLYRNDPVNSSWKKRFISLDARNLFLEFCEIRTERSIEI